MDTVQLKAIIYDQEQQPVSDARVIVVLDRFDQDINDKQYILPKQQSLTTDANGEVLFSAWKNSEGVRSSSYVLQAFKSGYGELLSVTFTVPDSAVDGTNIMDIATIAPFPSKSEYVVALEVVQAEVVKAVAARDEAVIARGEAVTARDEAVSARDIAVTASNTAVTARDEAVAAKNESSTARDEAVAARNTAVTARDTAVTAKDEAVAARNATTTARDEALTARDITVTAKNEAVAARDDVLAVVGDINAAIDAINGEVI